MQELSFGKERESAIRKPLKVSKKQRDAIEPGTGGNTWRVLNAGVMFFFLFLFTSWKSCVIPPSPSTFTICIFKPPKNCFLVAEFYLKRGRFEIKNKMASLGRKGRATCDGEFFNNLMSMYASVDSATDGERNLGGGPRAATDGWCAMMMCFAW